MVWLIGISGSPGFDDLSSNPGRRGKQFNIFISFLIRLKYIEFLQFVLPEQLVSTRFHHFCLTFNEGFFLPSSGPVVGPTER